MKKKSKILILGLFINTFLFSNLFIPVFFPQTSPKLNIFSLKSPNILFKILEFTLNNLWSTNDKAFLYYQNQDGSFSEDGKKYYTSYNAWSYFTMLEVAELTNNPIYYDNYSIPCLEYILTHLLNKSTYGVYHWCYDNGSIPSTDNINIYNDSTQVIGTYQAWTIHSLLNAYNRTGNTTYRDNYTIPMLNFMLTKLWDAENQSFFEHYFYNGVNDYVKWAWYQQWPIIALLEAYETTNNITYIEYANKTLNFLLTYLWDNESGGFYLSCQRNGSNPITDKTLRDQAGGISALVKAVTVLNNVSLIGDYIVPTLNFTTTYLWNNEYGQFITSTNRTGGDPDLIVRPSEISFLLKSLLEIPNNFNLSSYNNYTLKSTSHILNRMRDGYAFCKIYDLTSGIVNSERWTIEQIFPILILSKICNNNIKCFHPSTDYFIWQEEDPYSFYKIFFVMASIVTIITLNLLLLKELNIFELILKHRAKSKRKKEKFARKKISLTD